jgi:hypothetical protein
VIDQSLAHPRIRRERQARTNKGMYAALERRYWRGSLTDEQQERFEDLIYLLRTLYRAASSY